MRRCRSNGHWSAVGATESGSVGVRQPEKAGRGEEGEEGGGSPSMDAARIDRAVAMGSEDLKGDDAEEEEEEEEGAFPAVPAVNINKAVAKAKSDVVCTEMAELDVELKGLNTAGMLNEGIAYYNAMPNVTADDKKKKLEVGKLVELLTNIYDATSSDDSASHSALTSCNELITTMFKAKIEIPKKKQKLNEAYDYYEDLIEQRNIFER